MVEGGACLGVAVGGSQEGELSVDCRVGLENLPAAGFVYVLVEGVDRAPEVDQVERFFSVPEEVRGVEEKARDVGSGGVG